MRSSFSSGDPFALPAHGGNLAAAERRFGAPAAGWLDLSTGISPFSYPLPDLPLSHYQRLPDAREEARLREAAALCYGVGDAEGIVVSPGSQAVIQSLPRLRPFSRVAVISPTYAEHAQAWSALGHQVQSCEGLERIGDADVVVVVNPNNPDGRRHERGRLLQLAEQLAGRGGLLVLDEAFADCEPEFSLAPDVRPGLVVLRSFGKFFGMAGLRLGFAIADPGLARSLRAALGPWPVNGPAMAIGALALADKHWMAGQRRRLMTEAGLLDSVLTRADLHVAGGTALFRLINAPRAWSLYEHLGQNGILVRPFQVAPRWLRVGLPPTEEARERLRAALQDWRKMGGTTAG